MKLALLKQSSTLYPFRFPHNLKSLNGVKRINCNYLFILTFPIGVFQGCDGLRGLSIQDCLSGASFLNVLSRPETARKETILGRPSFGSVNFLLFGGGQENEPG